MGVAGCLAAYVGSIRHPLDEPSVLEFHPFLWGIRTTIIFSVAAVMLYLFYLFGKESQPSSLLYLAAGNYFAFYGFSKIVVQLRRAERQRLVWESMTKDERVDWIMNREKRLQEFREFMKRSEKSIRETKKLTEQVYADIKSQKAADRARRREALFEKVLVRPTYRIRERLGLVTSEERWRKREAETRFQQLRDQVQQERIKRVRAGEIRPLLIEGSELKVFPADPWKLILIDGELDTSGSNELIKKMEPLGRNEAGKLSGVMLVIGRTASVTIQARQALSDAGAKVVDEAAGEQDDLKT